MLALLEPLFPLLLAAGSSVNEFFRWNESDLTQFSSAEVGSSVSAHSESVVSYGGKNWVEIEVTTNAGGTFFDTGVVLPMAVSPPSANYWVYADFLNRVAGSGEIGAGVLVRYLAGTNDAYSVRYVDQGTNGQEMSRWDANVRTQLGPLRSDPDLNGVDQGSSLALGVCGTGSDALLEMLIGEMLEKGDNSPITATNKPAIIQSTNGVITTCRSLFRNIVAFEVN